jgi:energy-coupling factor transporter transmembrane protein EcfT
MELYLRNKNFLVKTILFLVCLILATISGFVFAGIFGSFLFAIILTFNIYILKKLKGKKIKAFNITILFFSLALFGYGLMHLGGLLGAKSEVLKKLSLIEEDLVERNYNPSWIIISQKRHPLLNSLLNKSAKDSYHLKGLAIDIYVFDINGDGIFDASDIKILEIANNNVEREHPELIGAFGDYSSKENGYLTKHMIHLDIRGYKVRYSK